MDDISYTAHRDKMNEGHVANTKLWRFLKRMEDEDDVAVLEEHSHWCLGCDSAWMEKKEECTEEFARAANRTYSFKLCPPCDAPFDYHEAEVGA